MKNRFRYGIGFLISLLVVCALAASASAQTLKTENVIVVTVDGLRVQEMFGGVDPALVTGATKSSIESLEIFKKKYWADTPEKRREALFPYFWKTFIKNGVILGNPAKNSTVKMKNPHHFSYPGYAEILTGRPQPAINSNDPVQNPAPTILDFVKEKMKLSDLQVAVFGAWTRFNEICTHTPGSFLINAGYEDLPENLMTDRSRMLNVLQRQMLTPWDVVRFDATTFGFAVEHLKTQKPRLLYIALGETDDWSHLGRYDRYIEMAHYLDICLKELWDTTQSMAQYRDKTTFVIATDHGRGETPKDWDDHSSKIPGSDRVWIAAVGPDTPQRGELSNTPDYYQASLAATVLRYLGLDYKEYSSEAEPPIKEMF